MTVTLMLIVLFSDQSTPLRTVVPMPTLAICGRAIGDAEPPATIEGHIVAAWSASCVLVTKTVGS